MSTSTRSPATRSPRCAISPADYDTSRALCRAHGTLLQALQSFELDLHRHIHEERNILFPHARARTTGRS
jgi:iron-sulfur cluster repair protein YtfE (RIC family)